MTKHATAANMGTKSILVFMRAASFFTVIHDLVHFSWFFKSQSTKLGLQCYHSVYEKLRAWEPGNNDSRLQGLERLTGNMKFFNSGKWLSISSIHCSSLCTWLSLKVVWSKNTEFLLSWITGHHACSHEPSCTQFSWTRIQLCFNINKYNN